MSALGEWFFNFISIVVIVCIQEFATDDKTLPRKTTFIVLWIVVFLVFSGVQQYYKFIEEKAEKERGMKEQQNERAKNVLTQVTQLIDKKTRILKASTKEESAKNSKMPFYYSVEDYFTDICDNLRRTIALLIQNEENFIDVSLIYHNTKEENWRWLAGKSGLSGHVDLGNELKNEKYLFKYIIDHHEEMPILRNKKEEFQYYSYGRRDRLFDNKGSFFAMTITFSNGNESLIESILLINTYGCRFLKDKSTEQEENEFRRILANEIVPYYVSLIQAEFGALYLQEKQKAEDSLSSSAQQ